MHKTPGAINALRGLCYAITAKEESRTAVLFYFARLIIMSGRNPLQCLSPAITTGAEA
jgi:hypothetical protein